MSCGNPDIKKLKFKFLVVCGKLPSGDVFFFFFFLKTRNQSAAGNVIQQIKKKSLTWNENYN